jgi:hypothetical protein
MLGLKGFIGQSTKILALWRSCKKSLLDTYGPGGYPMQKELT